MRNLHLVRRNDVKLWEKILYYTIGILISLLIGAAMLSSLDIDPIKYYKQMVTIGLIGNKYPEKAIEGLLKIFVPLLIVSLALSLSYRMKFWNVGGEGEFITGAVVAAIIAFKCSSLPGPVVILLMSLAAFMASGLIGLAVAVLKVKFNTNETLVTLMLNYIALYAITYIAETKKKWNFFLDEESARPKFAKFPDSAKMQGIKVGNVTILYSVLIAIALMIIIYFYLRSTKHGYEISVVGDSNDTARYAGMKVGRIIARTVFLSAALVGMAGAFSASTAATISTSITNNVGWTGVIVAWLAKLSTPGIFAVTVMISVLQYGCQAASVSYGSVDHNFADLMQGLILFSILVADFLLNFRIARRKEADHV